ncbi:fungal specific transcription factor domain-containing protein [Coprinopsis cinerea AmutBmut pab1-1]|nr:fungal specific transcription factor domain-containing protein [Coprinopsis cinerea AmutBmut pab1-1]
MQASRQNDSPELPSRRGPTTTSGSEMPTATSQQPPSQTSLPSIRQLHPYLGPPSGMSQPLTTGGAGYDYPGGSTHYPPGPLPQLDGAGQPPPQREQPEIYGGVESEQDDFDQHGPPKKKRRRQALSCTECKRRKIKCDRNQPCAPCSRRGEQAKCQWHIVEPVEKYVTRAEYDELKARFDQLWALVHRMLPPAPQTTVPYYQTMPPQPGPSVEAAQPYHYTPMLTPQQPYQPHLDGTPPVMQPLPPHRYPRPEDSHSPTRNAGPSSPLASTVQPLTQPPPSRSGRVGVVAGAGAGGVVGTAVVAGGGGGGGDPKSPGPSLYHVLLPQYRTVGVKKLLRADAHAGRASASRGPPGSRRLSNPPYYRSDPPRSAANPISSPSIPELYIDGTNPSLNPPQPFHHLPPQNSTGRRMSDASGRFPGLEDERSLSQ